MTGKRWLFPDCDDERCQRIASALKISPILAKMLINRGVTDVESAQLFLHPQLTDLHEPTLLPDIEPAAERIRQAIEGKERIVVYGDYDVDGITGTSVLLNFFQLFDLHVEYYIPHRVKEGYGMNLESLKQIQEAGADLIVTVDCGIGSVKEAEFCRQAGLDLVITDHHEPGVEIPSALAVVNPKLTGCLYPFRELSGVGVVFKLVWAVGKGLSSGSRVSPQMRRFLMSSLGLVAMGTIADVVPLVGENRIVAKFGLQALKHTKNHGVKALMEVARIDKQKLCSRDVSFGFGPRLNAAGRMAHAELGVELLTTDSPERAAEIAQQLDSKNKERQQAQRAIFEAAREQVAREFDLADTMAIVLADESWHPGIIGIVASKIVDEFSRPTVLIAVDEEAGMGSARSIPGFPLNETLRACRDVLLSHGGHAMAAGLKIAADRILEFRKRFNEEGKRRLSPDDLRPTVEIDAEVHFPFISRELVKEIELLAPYGEANPPPLLAATDVRVAGVPNRMGNNGKHLSFYARQGDTVFRVVAFGRGEMAEQLGESNGPISIAFRPKINEWQGQENLELHVEEFQVPESD